MYRRFDHAQWSVNEPEDTCEEQSTQTVLPVSRSVVRAWGLAIWAVVCEPLARAAEWLVLEVKGIMVNIVSL